MVDTMDSGVAVHPTELHLAKIKVLADERDFRTAELTRRLDSGVVGVVLVDLHGCREILRRVPVGFDAGCELTLHRDPAHLGLVRGGMVGDIHPRDGEYEKVIRPGFIHTVVAWIRIGFMQHSHVHILLIRRIFL